MTISRTSAYCVTCLTARTIAQAGMAETVTADFRVITGHCYVCSQRVIRVLPRMGDSIPEAPAEHTRNTYSGEDVYDYSQGRYVSPEGTQAQYRTLSLSYLLSRVSGSVDLAGKRADGMARWESIIAAKASASHFDQVLRVIMAEGLNMRLVMWAPDGADGDWQVGNGHHRLTAALLLGLDRVPVVVSTSSDYMRCEDSSDDEDRPIERDGNGRQVWDAIRDSLPREAGADGVVRLSKGTPRDCGGCGMGCDCCHNASCVRNPDNMRKATGTATRAQRDASQAAKAVRVAAQAAAGDAVWNLRQQAYGAARDAGARAQALRAEADRLIAEAASAEAEAEVLRAQGDAFGAYYVAAANLTAQGYR